MQWVGNHINVSLRSHLTCSGVNAAREEAPNDHPDHLGSSSFITDAIGYATQHLQYLPFGETFVDQKAGSFDSRYKFSAKEKDDETGYSYFGARYYDSDLSVWLSVDPMADKYPNLSPYAYCANNPVMLVDPNGMEFEDPEDEAQARSSQDAARTRIATLNTEISEINSKGELTKDDKKAIKDKESQIEILNKHITNIEEMINTKEWKFKYEKVDPNSAFGETRYEDGVVVIQFEEGRPDKTAHEETHGHQYITGELKISGGADNKDSYDLNDEASAYQVEYCFRDANGQSDFRTRLNVNSIRGVNDIIPSKLVQSKLIQDYYPEIIQKYKSTH